MLLKLFASLCATLVAYVLYRALNMVYRELTTPLGALPGPKSTHWFFGNAKELMDDNSGAEERWIKEFGRTMRLRRFLNLSQLYTIDTKAIHHVITNTHIYQKSEGQRYGLGRIVGPGVLVVEDDEHKQQRKIMNPAFGVPHIRELTSIFVNKSIQLRDIWAAQVTQSGGIARIEALSWLSKATLDVIGLAGFNYDINALGATEGTAPDELAAAFEAVFAAETSFSLIRFFQMRVPFFRRLPSRQDREIAVAQAVMKRIGRRLLAESKREIRENGTFEAGRGRDLLTLLVRANTAKDLPTHQQLSDEDVIAQVPTFLVAGHETTSTGVTWALFGLTQNTAAQTRLRRELLDVSTDTPTMDELNALPYLDCVVRETMRLYAPVSATGRMAMRDDVVPLSEAFTDANGVAHESVRIRKGQFVMIPIAALNRDVAVWGSDAMEFIPERWERDPPISNAIPGVWGHMLTFLGGPRSCIGYRFSLVETKALLFTLLRAFEFELAVPAVDIGLKGNAIVVRPMVRSDLAAGNQLPLLVKPVVR
ncbi:cytochrome P450 [Mycena pura]|uniref:Cytochrome P450 n=1 Tax=Mycena pura TaxID=153505 RepID=A0AAD6UQR0_9AGAR|nr:cytochrome P450 [Mycena pura]